VDDPEIRKVNDGVSVRVPAAEVMGPDLRAPQMDGELVGRR
jgi:hypothetical protein